jgi:hypothetical protein
MSIYHLHIPRTSGVYIRENLIKSFQDSNNFVGHKQAMPESFKTFDNISGHFANNPVKEADLTFAVIRNPVNLTFSYIQYMRDKFYPILTFDELFSKYEKEDKLKSFTNINTKFLTGFINVVKYNKTINDLKKLAENCWETENYVSTAAFAKKHLDNSDIKILRYEDHDLYKNISDIYERNIAEGVVNESSEIDSATVKKYVNIISELNWLDLELYEIIN